MNVERGPWTKQKERLALALVSEGRLTTENLKRSYHEIRDLAAIAVHGNGRRRANGTDRARHCSGVLKDTQRSADGNRYSS